MSGCERGRRTRCERGTEIHPTNRATTTPPAPAAPTEPPAPARGPAPPPPARTTRTTTSTMANSSSTTSSTGTNNTSTMTNPAQPSAPTQTPAQPAPASLAAVPPPAPAPQAGIFSVHVSMYAQDSKFYSYILQSKKLLARRFLYLYMFEMRTAVRYTAHKQTCIHKQIARMQTLENWKWNRNKALRTTLIWYMNYKSICKKSPKYCGHADWYDFPPSDAT